MCLLTKGENIDMHFLCQHWILKKHSSSYHWLQTGCWVIAKYLMKAIVIFQGVLSLLKTRYRKPKVSGLNWFIALKAIFKIK